MASSVKAEVGGRETADLSHLTRIVSHREQAAFSLHSWEVSFTLEHTGTTVK
jgi:hypothetical protein